MENNIKDKGTDVAKVKPKVTYKEVKRKMKKLTLTQKNRIKEDKKEQKAKDKAEKQRISQRVKININIPSSVNKSGQQTPVPLGPIFNPLNNQGSKDTREQAFAQISLLNSINEQLKNKNKPASINDMFKIPVKQSIETQTEPTQQYSQGSQTRVKQREQSTDYEPTQQYSQGTQQEPQVNRVIETQTENDDDFSQGIEDINNELQQRLAKIRLPEQFSPKVETPIPIIREPSIPIITKPEETSNENIIEKVTRRGRPKMTDEEKKQRAEERAREKEVERQIDEQEAILAEADTRELALAKQRQNETGMQRRAREKSQVEKQFQIDLKDAEKGLAEEMALRKKMNEEEIANTPALIRKYKLESLLREQQSLRQQVENERLRLKALKEQNEKDREIKRKNYEEYQALEKQKELKEKVEKDIRQKGNVKPTGENVTLKVKEIEARRKANEADNLKAEKKKEKEQIKLVQAEYKQKEKEQKQKQKELEKEMELRRKM